METGFYVNMNAKGYKMSISEKESLENRAILRVEEEPIEMFKVLKLENLVGSGGEAKYVVAEGLVRLNGVVETRKRKKVFSGDIVEFQGVQIQVAVSMEDSNI